MNDYTATLAAPCDFYACTGHGIKGDFSTYAPGSPMLFHPLCLAQWASDKMRMTAAGGGLAQYTVTRPTY